VAPVLTEPRTTHGSSSGAALVPGELLGGAWLHAAKVTTPAATSAAHARARFLFMNILRTADPLLGM